MTHKHWTNDPELIERFVLRKMNPEERNELEDHLRICEVCKRTVRAEQVLLAGIRRSGREQFKSELRKKILASAAEEKTTPWMKILSVAAVVTILFTVGIYNRWFETQETSHVFTDATGPLHGPDETQTSKPEETPRASPQLTAKSSTQDEIRRIATSPRASVPPPGAMKTEEHTNPTADADNVAGAVSERADVVPRESEGTPTAGVIWIEGNILRTYSNALRDKAKPHEGVAGGYSEKTTGLPSAPGAERRVAPEPTATNGTVVLNQQNSLALPTAQQRIQQLNKSANARQSDVAEPVMTKLERVGNQTQLTLYLDSLVDENDLANASIETPRRDSLILNLPNQRIGYRLPRTIDARQLRIAK
jgi:hypothetical protein